MRPLLTLTPFDAAHALVTSPFFSPPILAAVRLAFAAYALVTLVVSIVWGAVVQHDAAGFFSYFTHLTYTGLCAYFFAAGVQTALFARRGKGYPLQGWPRALRFLHLALLATVTVFPLLVSVVFWGVLADKDTFATRYDAWSAISVHLLNSVFALFEIALTNTPAPAWVLLPVTLLVLGGYVGVVYVTHATQGFYAYSFMAPNSRLALHMAGVALAQVVLYVVVWCLVSLRVWLVRRYMTRPRGIEAGPGSETSLGNLKEAV
ncbi:hypothetical protein MIND_00389400 [Mycena indigotica]|uniref:FAR-17a/AIG1-like protein n=1 Tax=Mycena indigotica TaxID=2126181 RepID=A0A8H6T197_9AGAR|nr:uncharacterized protein MIND_00389400 [Mycena indigotica]KAF7310160.1 hypothetical protein MIND_00389400 [Mycena indigotica]